MKNNVGYRYLQQFEKTYDDKSYVDVRELRDHLLKKSDYRGELIRTVENNKDKPLYYGKDFFVEVISNYDRLLTTIIKNTFSARDSCPAPIPRTAVYMYRREDETIHFLWQLPPLWSIQDLYYNRNVPREHNSSLDTVIEYMDGTLIQRVNKINKEKRITGTIRIKSEDK